MKRILPTLRQKKRYIVFEIIADKKIRDIKAVSKAIWDNSLKLLGELGVSKAEIWVLTEKFDLEMQRGIVKVNNKYLPQAKSALLMVDKIGNQKVVLKTVGVSGILNKACQKYLTKRK